MNTLLEILFWTAISVLAYSYVVYGLIVFCLNKIFAAKSATLFDTSDEKWPFVSLIIAAFNEADCIEDKITNSLLLDYPTELLEIIFVTDGSTDQTAAIVASFEPSVRLMHQNARLGKSAAINRAVAHAINPIVIFSDANTMLNCDAVKKIVQHYKDEKVGGVSGEKRIVSALGVGAAAAEGLYWKYESWLKKGDSNLYSVVGAAGELFSVRKNLYEPVPNDIILDDFFISLSICKMGFVVKYEPDAYAEELPSINVQEEQKRKVRIAAGGFQAMAIFKPLLNVFKFKWLSFQYFSHRVLRWAFCPFLLPIVFISNLLVLITDGSSVYISLFTAQIIFYFLAIIGWVLKGKQVKLKIISVPYYFFFMNLAVLMGWWKYRTKNQSAVWERVARAKFTT